MSPHIGDSYREIAEAIRLVLETGYTRLRRLSNAQRKEVAALSMIIKETSQLLETRCGEDTRYRIVGWIWPRYGCTDMSALATTDQMLELKGKLIGLASGKPPLSTFISLNDEIATSLQEIDSRLETVGLAVSRSFTRVSPGLTFKDYIRYFTEFTIFDSFPVLGRLFRWPRLWSWITGTDDMAIRFLARSVIGHTLSVREDVAAARARCDEWTKAFAARGKTLPGDELNLQGIGAGGQGLVDALRSILDAAQKIKRQRDMEERMAWRYLGPLFSSRDTIPA
ncbi:hypothetical protein GGS24DRAFT_475053 [Hypoxylon argillaceum]|nr:hypothetical protein GGS24DRAFT_475053 [Hypoxylon argillaceum]